MRRGGEEIYGDACKNNEKNRVQKREFEKTDNMEKYHNTLAVDNAKKEDKPKRYTQGKLPGAISYEDKALCAQAHWFMYSSTVQSFEVFRSEEFKEMLQAMIPKNESKLKAPILDVIHLKEYINAEWVAFKKNLRKTINPHLEEAKGNLFCQFIHDGVTLNKSKYQAYAMQFTDSKFRCNHVIAMSFRRIKSSTAQVVSELANAVTK